MAETLQDHTRARRALLLLPVAVVACRSPVLAAMFGLATALAPSSRAASPARIATAGGPAARKDAALPEFDRLILDVPADVTIVIAQQNRIMIEAEQAVIDSIAYSRQGRSLHVFAARSFETRHPIAVVITCRGLTSLDARGAVNTTLEALPGAEFSVSATGTAAITLTRLNLDSLSVDIGGSAALSAEGEARFQEVVAEGTASYDGRKLRSVSARVEASGSSEVAINARERLQVTGSGAATVRYGGNPKLEQELDGAATLERFLR